jgi:hypothetical protein
MGRKHKQPKGPTEAQRADIYALYEEAVQDPEGDVALIRRIYKRHFNREPRTLREDFCGTAVMACTWIREHADNRAVGVDLDPDPLKWCREHHVPKLKPEQAARLELVEGDVLDVTTEPVDIAVAFNFSYFVFHERRRLVEYFRKARAALGPEGLFVIDLYGGADSQRTLAETREHDDFDYVWDQDVFDPIQNHAINYIHFQFEDGSEIEKAFTYDWRLWSIPELRDALHEAGFGTTEAYWERTDRKSNEGTGVYYKAERAPDDPAWVAYVSALP